MKDLNSFTWDYKENRQARITRARSNNKKVSSLAKKQQGVRGDINHIICCVFCYSLEKNNKK